MPNTVKGERRVGDISIRSSGGIPLVEETYVFLVEAESKDASRISVMFTPGLPVVNQTVSSFGLTVCRTMNAVRMAGKATLWEVTCGFSSEVEENQIGSSGQAQADPTQWVPVYETKFERVQQVVSRDYAGNPIVNSAGQRFPAGLTITRKLPQWELYQFEPATVTDMDVINRSEVVNSVAFRGFGIKTILCVVLSSQIGFYYGARLRFTRYSLTYDPYDWRHKRLDIGRAFKSGATLLPYTDNDGNIIEGALNGTGGKVAAVGDDPSILNFDMYNAVNLSSFIRF